MKKLVFLALLTACGTEEETTTTTYSVPTQVSKFPNVPDFIEVPTSTEYCKSGTCYAEFTSPVSCKVTYVVSQIAYKGTLITGARIDVEMTKGKKILVEYPPANIEQQKTAYQDQARTIYSCPVMP